MSKNMETEACIFISNINKKHENANIYPINKVQEKSYKNTLRQTCTKKLLKNSHGYIGSDSFHKNSIFTKGKTQFAYRH